jgi:hypothetical protein
MEPMSRESSAEILEESKPLLDEIERVREELEKTVLPKSPLAEALSYIKNHWGALNRFLEDGRPKNRQ